MRPDAKVLEAWTGDAVLLLDARGEPLAAGPQAAALLGWSGAAATTLDAILPGSHALLAPLHDPHATPRLTVQAAAGTLSAHAVAHDGGIAVRLLAARPQDSNLDLLRTIAHDLKTPLSAIVGMQELLGLGHLSESQRRSVDASIDAAFTARSLIDNVLDWARGNAGSLQPSVSPFHVQDLLDGVVHLLSLRAAEKGLFLSVHIDEGVPHYLLDDVGMLRQILLNLVSNAVKYTPQGEVTVRVCTEGGALCYAVEDSGPGVPQSMRARLFVPFDTLGHTGSDSTGLGLSIARRLAGALGGDVTFAPRPAGGSVFTLRVPLREQLAPERRTLQPGGAPLRALLFGAERVTDSLANLLAHSGVDADGVQGLDDVLSTLRGPAGHDVSLYFHDVPSVEDDARTVGFVRALQEEHRAHIVLVVPPGLELDLPRRGNLRVRTLERPVTRRSLDALLTQVASEDSLEPERWAAVLGPSTTAPQRVLVVDDARENRVFAESGLAAAGHHVLAVENGMEALDALRTHTFDVVLLDIHMPVLDGLETLSRVRAGAVGAAAQSVRVLAYTAVDPNKHKSLLAAGFDGVVEKPTRLQTLLRAVGGRSAPVPPRTNGTPVEALPVSDGPLGAQTTEARLALVRRDQDGLEACARQAASDLGLTAAQRRAAAELLLAAQDADFDTARALLSGRDKPTPAPAPRARVVKPDFAAVKRSADAAMRALIPAWLDERRAQAAAMRDALTRGDYRVIREEAHKLIGTGATYGFPALTTLARTLQTAARASDAAACHTALSKLTATLSALRPEDAAL